MKHPRHVIATICMPKFINFRRTTKHSIPYHIYLIYLLTLPLSDAMLGVNGSTANHVVLSSNFGRRSSTDISSSQLNVHHSLVISLIQMFVFKLDGLAPPKIATFSFGDAPLNFGESASVQCTVSGGDLPMTVEWTLNGLPIPTYLEVSTPKIGKRIHVLSIDSVKADHAGNYSCVATNQAGMAEFTAPLIVIGLSANGPAIFAIFPTLRVCVARLGRFLLV